MKKLLIRAASMAVILALTLGLTLPAAQAGQTQTFPEGVEPITIEAASALLIDMESEQILYEQNADEQRYPASITKVMTALLTLEAIGRGDLAMDTMITVPPEALMDITKDSSTANIVAGEEISVKDLLYCLLLASANEAANILAIAVGGDIPSFVGLMNQRAQQLGMTHTKFANPHGLHNPEHYTTAKDIFKMGKQAMTHAPFRDIVSTSQYTTAATNKSEPRALYNTNGLLSNAFYYGYAYRGTIGIKTGHTEQAGYCLLSASRQKGRTLVSVVLGAQNPMGKNNKPIRKQFIESRRLLDWGFTNFSAAPLLDADTYLEEVPVRFSAQSAHVVLQPERSVTTFIPGPYDKERLELRLHLDHEKATAPVTTGDVLGSVDVIYDGEKYDTVPMIAINDVAFSPAMAFVTTVNAILGNLFVRILLLIALVLLIVGLVRRFRTRIAEARKEERKRRQEQKIQLAEIRRQREAEAQKQAEQNRRQKEEQRRQKQQEEARQREERKKKDRERRQEEDRRRAEQDRRRAEQDRRRDEQERRWAEQDRRQRDRRSDQLPYDNYAQFDRPTAPRNDRGGTYRPDPRAASFRQDPYRPNVYRGDFSRNDRFRDDPYRGYRNEPYPPTRSDRDRRDDRFRDDRYGDNRREQDRSRRPQQSNYRQPTAHDIRNSGSPAPKKRSHRPNNRR